MQEVEIQLGNRIYTPEFLVASLGVDCSGVVGLDFLRRMEAKVDLCSGGLLSGGEGTVCRD